MPELTEHDRWVQSIDGGYTTDTVLGTVGVSFADQYEQGLANAYADGCGYMLCYKGGYGMGTERYELAETMDGGKSWIVRGEFALPSQFSAEPDDKGDLMTFGRNINAIAPYWCGVSTYGGILYQIINS